MTLSTEDDFSENPDAIVKQLRAILSEDKRPTMKKSNLKSKKSSALAAMLIHTLRSDLRSMGGLEAPEEFIFEQKPKIKLVPAVKLIPPMPEPEGPHSPEPFGFDERTGKVETKAKLGKKVMKKETEPRKKRPEMKKTKKKISGKERLLRLLARRLRK